MGKFFFTIVTMHAGRILLKLFVFLIVFSFIFYLIRYFNLQPKGNSNYIPWLFSAISLIFSIISGFVIQSKWQTWNELIDATHGETASLKQLHMLASHFPKSIQKTVRDDIRSYLMLIINESFLNNRSYTRSNEVESSIYELEETVLDIDYSEHPTIGSLAFDLIRKCIEYREKRLQNLSHKLPIGVKLFTIIATVSVVGSSLFIGEDIRLYDYIFTLVISLLAFGVYLLIDDLDNPYRPGQWHLKNDEYVILLEEVDEYIKNPPQHHDVKQGK